MNESILKQIQEDPIRNLESYGGYDEYKYMMFMLPIVLDVHVVVETGLSQGNSTRIFLESLSQLDGARALHTYEIERRTYQATIDDILKRGYRAQWIVHYEDSKLAKWAGADIDLLFLDADHQYDAVQRELEAFSPHLSEKALILGHDAWPPEGGRHECLARKSGGWPSDVWWAMRDWAVEYGWKNLLFRHPWGMCVLYKNRYVKST